MPNREIIKQSKKVRRRGRVRSKVFGIDKKPRFSVFRSLNHIYAQLIDDQKGITLASAKDIDIKKNGKKSEMAFRVGELIAKKAKEKNIEQVVFDKGSNRYHGRVKSVADGARKGGLKF
jgi:large subunit ribosomal protein L18